MEKALAFAQERGLTPQAVPLKTLFPLLEHASLEDDDALQDRWAALLATAAGDPNAVPPSFPGILNELSPTEGRMLQLMVDDMLQLMVDDVERGYVSMGPTGARGVKAEEFQQALGIALDDYAVYADNLVRLGLVYGEEFVMSRFAGDVGVLTGSRAVLALSSLGGAFMRACTPPG